MFDRKLKRYSILLLIYTSMWPVLAQGPDQSQDIDRVGKVYRTGIDMDVFVDNGDGRYDNDAIVIAAATTAYRVLSRREGRIYIEIFKINTDGQRAVGAGGAPLASFVNTSNYSQNYYVLAANLAPVNYLRTSGLTAGGLLLPLKFRGRLFKNSTRHEWQMSTDVALGQYFGYRLSLGRRSPVYVNLIATLGGATLNINSDNTDPDSEQSTLLGISAAGGLIIQVNDLQLGLVFGRDFAPGSVGADWIYNEENWLSFGIGLKFISNESW